VVAQRKVALDVAIGASFAGVRALAAMKHVGLNVASDSLMSQAYIGVNGGLVLAVCDDPGIHSSQNEQDSRFFAEFARIPVLEPSDGQEALDFTRLAFEMSERFDTPVRRAPPPHPERFWWERTNPLNALRRRPAEKTHDPAYARLPPGAVRGGTLALFDSSSFCASSPGGPTAGSLPWGSPVPLKEVVPASLETSGSYFPARTITISPLR
jgi:indolepyruvate ferredoxin oxidoreductase alpha subunit